MAQKKEFECHFCETIKKCGTEDIHPKDFQELESDKKVKTTKIGLNENKVKTIQHVKTGNNDEFGFIGTLGKAKKLSPDDMVQLAKLTLQKCSFKISTTQRKHLKMAIVPHGQLQTR